MKKTQVNVVFSVVASVLVSFNCFAGMFSADVMRIVHAQRAAFSAAPDKIAQCNVIKAAINNFKQRVEQQPHTMRMNNSPSIRWNWQEKFYNPILNDFTQVCATGFKKTNTVLAQAIKDVIKDAHVVRDLFVHAPHASNEAKHAADFWFTRMLQATGLKMRANKAGFYTFSFGKDAIDSDDDETGGEDTDNEDEDDDGVGITIGDLKNTKKALSKLSKKLSNVKKKFFGLKASKKKRKTIITEIRRKLDEIDSFTELIESMINAGKSFDTKFLKKLQRMHKKLEKRLQECQEKILKFLAEDEDEE